jgi:hypothetical protein
MVTGTCGGTEIGPSKPLAVMEARSVDGGVGGMVPPPPPDGGGGVCTVIVTLSVAEIFNPEQVRVYIWEEVRGSDIWIPVVPVHPEGLMVQVIAFWEVQARVTLVLGLMVIPVSEPLAFISAVRAGIVGGL